VPQSIKSEENHLFISGYYSRQENQNLAIYGQIYNTRTGKVISALNITNDDLSKLGIKLPEEEIREPDETVIRKFATKIALISSINRNGKIENDRIEDYILQSSIGKDISFPIEKEDVSQAADSVFDILNQTTFSSTKTAKSTREVPNIVSNISGKEIVDYGRLSINEVLYHLPGFSSSQDYERRTVSSRGTFENWNNSHYMFLVDGIQFNDNLYGTAYTWEITPTNMIKSLEVIRGPGSALYGSNSTNGVISLNTYSGEDFNGKIETRTRVGSQGLQILDLATGNKGNLFSYFVSYSSLQTSGNNYNSYDASARGWDTGQGLFLRQQFRIRDARKNDYLFLKLEGEGALKGFSIQYHKQYWDFQTGFGWIFRIPDFKESMNEGRQIVTLKYSNQLTSKLTQEYVIRYQKKEIDWLTRFAENGSYENFYPGGIWEQLKTGGEDIFGRVQYSYSLASNGANILGGVEGNYFVYKGDKEHWSNAELSDSANGFPPTPNGEIRTLGPWFEWIKNKPIRKRALFLQLVSGKLFDKFMEVTLGLRNDFTSQNYRGIDKPFGDANRTLDYFGVSQRFAEVDKPVIDDPILSSLIPNEKRTFNSTNPRVGLVFFPTKNLTVKAMAGTAFREPAPAEQFGANTFTLTSNPRGLKPEKIRTYELGFDWFIIKNLNLRVNGFETFFENMVAYSTSANNALANVYSLRTRGIESELLFVYSKNLKGFINFSRNWRLDEQVLDRTVSVEKKTITWVPATNANFGVNGTYSSFQFAVLSNLQYPSNTKEKCIEEKVIMDR
jgi:iron complex outermembrane receptor protein